ncbi:MAG: hypothetical protein R3C99_19145 [Pirellulaceae bacterium]
MATWPLALHARSHLPLGQEGVATVPLLNAWTMWWNGRAAEQGFSNYWDAPIFYPERDALAFSEPLPTTLAAWPLYKLTGSVTWAYNTLLLVSLTLNGISTFALLRHLRLDHRAALLGGAMMTVLPFVFAELGVWQLVALFPTIWTLHALLLWVSRPSYGRGALLGGGWTHLLDLRLLWTLPRDFIGRVSMDTSRTQVEIAANLADAAARFRCSRGDDWAGR